MSKGYFFELNQRLSAIENGIAIFDYTELPDPEGSNLDNPLMVQYPISVNINADAVCFKLHYYSCHYINDKSIDYHQHLESSAIDQGNWGLTHVEDVILELPFVDNATSRLSSVIKNSYNTEFPLKYSEELQGYIEHLIRNQFKIKTQTDTSKVPIRPSDIFYSSQWLMDIYDNSGKINVFENNTAEGRITKFLRKLILDFMFDMKHSDVFQSSTNFQKMYTGLMSDFYFSSLMHKCEFFYYRDLVTRQVESLSGINSFNRFSYLYTKELFNAQELWTNDIMNPLSESFFEHDFPNLKVQFSSICFEKMNDKKWSSWFATPEEEMRRVYFTMKEWGKRCNCNADTLTEFLDLNIKDDEGIKAMLAFRQENREKVSRWFLSRYDFNDVFHLHFCRWSNITFLALALFFLLFLFFGKQYIERTVDCVISLIINHTYILAVLAFGLLIIRSMLSMNKVETLLSAHYQLYSKRMLEIGAGFCTLTFLLFEGIKNNSLLLLKWGWFTKWEWFIKLLIAGCCIVALLFAFIVINRILINQKLEIKQKGLSSYIKRQFLAHPIRNMHIVLPKLFASITAAWLTLSTGYVIYNSFYDIEVSFLVPIVITTIVISFTISRISRTMPTASSILIFLRAVEITIISYCIALAIGLIAINFVGERFIYQYSAKIELAQKDLVRLISTTHSHNIDTINYSDSIIMKANQSIYETYQDIKRNNFFPLEEQINKKNNYERLIAVNFEIPKTDYDLLSMPDFKIKTDIRPTQNSSYSNVSSSSCISDTVVIMEANHSIYNIVQQDGKKNIFHISKEPKKKNNNHERLIAVNYEIPKTDHDLFIMPDFLIMFSFITMFIGIFLQMAFFDNRQMTDF